MRAQGILKTDDLVARFFTELCIEIPIANQKCSTLRIGLPASTNELNIGGVLLPTETVCRDLGVLVSANLGWSNQVTAVVKKANNVSNMLFRCFLSAPWDSLLRAYKTYVRPIMEYSTPVWSPYLRKDILKLEKAQNYFTRRVYVRGKHEMVPHDKRNEILGLDSLELRRLKQDLIMVYKIIFHLVDIKFMDLFSLAAETGTRHRCFKLAVEHSRIDARRKSFACRVVGVWNLLPEFITCSRGGVVVSEPLIRARSLQLFKSRLNRVDLTSLALRASYDKFY